MPANIGDAPRVVVANLEQAPASRDRALGLRQGALKAELNPSGPRGRRAHGEKAVDVFVAMTLEELAQVEPRLCKPASLLQHDRQEQATNAPVAVYERVDGFWPNFFRSRKSNVRWVLMGVGGIGRATWGVGFRPPSQAVAGASPDPWGSSLLRSQRCLACSRGFTEPRWDGLGRCSAQGAPLAARPMLLGKAHRARTCAPYRRSDRSRRCAAETHRR
jgi:hypothetical protein